MIANTACAAEGHHGHSGPSGNECQNLVADPISASEGRTYSHEGSHNFRLHNVMPGVRRLTTVECSRLQGFPDSWLNFGEQYANAEEANAGEVLRIVWRAAYEVSREGWRPGELAALLTPEVLLAGVHEGWVSWAVARACAEASGTVAGAHAWPEGFLRGLREAERSRPSPYRRQSFEQLARELGRSLSELPLEEAQAIAHLLSSGVLKEAPPQRLLRHARPTRETMGRSEHRQNQSARLSDSTRYKMLGNAVAVPCAEWIGRRIMEASE